MIFFSLEEEIKFDTVAANIIITDLDEIGFLIVLVMLCQKTHKEVIIMDHS